MKTFTLEFFKEKGKKGGLTTKKKYGKKHYEKIGSKGGKARKLSTGGSLQVMLNG